MNAIFKGPDFFSLVSAAEGDMRKVYDHAFLLYDHLSRAGDLSDDEKGALIWPAADLLKAGGALREHCDAMYSAARRFRSVTAPAPQTSASPKINPSALSGEQLLALFDALGTVYDVMCGLLSQPRFINAKHELNDAGELLDRISEVVTDARDVIRNEALARSPKCKRDLAPLVFFAAEEWTDGSCEPGPALAGLTAALNKLGEKANG